MSAVAPDEDAKLAEVSTEVSAVVARARAIVVETPEQANDATAFLAEMKAAKDRAERARHFLVDPLNKHVKTINDRVKGDLAPLVEADQLVRVKVSTYLHEQAVARAQEQARLDAQREREEAEARVERERTEAAAREAEAAAEHARAAAEDGGRAAELVARAAELDDDALREIATGGRQWERAAAKRILEQRLADKVAAKARQAAEEATQADIAAQSAPALAVAPAAPLASENGSASVRHEWKATIVDSSRVPRRYLVPDVKAINAAVRAGERDIPGVRIEQVPVLAVSAK
jgi:hypothetical protein